MKTKEVCELLGKTILLLNDNRSKPYTKMLLLQDNYTEEQVNSVFDYIYKEMNLPK